MVKGILHEGFKIIADNWWTAIRNEVNSYEGFKQLFKLKYWSESVQNIVRDNLCNGRYGSTRGETPAAYFLGKICIARYLEPKIADECLVTKIAYHYEEGIVHARLSGQVKTIGGMEALLESYEQEAYYRRNRRRPENPNKRRNDQPRDNRQRVNYVRTYQNNNNHNNNNNNRFRGQRSSFNNERTYENQYQREDDNRRPQ